MGVPRWHAEGRGVLLLPAWCWEELWVLLWMHICVVQGASRARWRVTADPNPGGRVVLGVVLQTGQPESRVGEGEAAGKSLL